MKEFIWSSDLDTGDISIDQQHKKLFSYLNNLIRAENSNEPRSKSVKTTLDNLIEYTVIHFEEEELVLERSGYPNLLGHQKLHIEFANKATELKERFENGEEILSELITFVQNWLVIHIKQVDIQALKFLKK
jgi:hemerythrin-like metal-binding protein